MPVEIADEVKPGAAAPAGTVTAVRRLLADLEDLKVTLADGPPALVERLLTTAAAEVWRGSADREAAWAAPGGARSSSSASMGTVTLTTRRSRAARSSAGKASARPWT